MNKTTNYTPLSNLLGALGPPLFHVSKVIRIAPQWGNLDHFGSFLKKGALGALMNEKKTTILIQNMEQGLLSSKNEFNQHNQRTQ